MSILKPPKHQIALTAKDVAMLALFIAGALTDGAAWLFWTALFFLAWRYVEDK